MYFETGGIRSWKLSSSSSCCSSCSEAAAITGTAGAGDSWNSVYVLDGRSTAGLKGKVKETVGILTGDKKMEREGSLQRAEGAVQEGLGKAGRKVGEAMTNLGNAIKK